MTLCVAALFLPLAPGQDASVKTQPQRWLGVFTPLPGARRLCSQHILGQAEGKRVEISFTLYGTSREPAETARFYAVAHGIPLESGKQTISVALADGRKILSVHPVSAPHPECGVEPASSDRTVIVVSEKVS